MSEQNKVIPLRKPEPPGDGRMIVTMTLGELREVVREELAAKQNDGHHSPALLSSAQVAEQWNVPATWIEEAGRTGKLPRVEIGSYVRFKAEDIERFIEENRRAKN